MIFENPAIIALVAAIPSVALGYLVYRQSKKTDKITEQSSAASSQATAVDQVIQGLNKLIDNIQEDNKLLRENVDELRVRLKETMEENHNLQEEVRDLHIKYDV